MTVSIKKDCIEIAQETNLTSDLYQTGKVCISNKLLENIKKNIDLNNLPVKVEKKFYFINKDKKKEYFYSNNYNFSGKEWLNLERAKGKNITSTRIILNTDFDFKKLKEEVEKKDNDISVITNQVEELIITTRDKNKDIWYDEFCKEKHKNAGKGEILVSNIFQNSGLFPYFYELGGSRNHYEGYLDKTNGIKYEVKSARVKYKNQAHDFQLSAKSKNTIAYKELEIEAKKTLFELKKTDKFKAVQKSKLPGTTFFNHLKKYYPEKYEYKRKKFENIYLDYLDNAILIIFNRNDGGVLKIFNTKNLIGNIHIDKYDKTAGFKPAFLI